MTYVRLTSELPWYHMELVKLLPAQGKGEGKPTQGKEAGKDQESIQSSITPDPGHHMGK